MKSKITSLLGVTLVIYIIYIYKFYLLLEYYIVLNYYYIYYKILFFYSLKFIRDHLSVILHEWFHAFDLEQPVSEKYFLLVLFHWTWKFFLNVILSFLRNSVILISVCPWKFPGKIYFKNDQKKFSWIQCYKYEVMLYLSFMSMISKCWNITNKSFFFPRKSLKTVSVQLCKNS